jgi:hypothetical protein
MTPSHRHVVLLGDSIFDNAAYTSGAPDVIAHLRGLLPPDWQATLLARDGATTAGIEDQVRRVPPDVTNLVISVGGNDALQNSDLLRLPVRSSAQALEAFASRMATFEAAYRRAIRLAMTLGRPTALCTIYNGALDPGEADIARMGLAIFNDAILRTAIDLQLDALELRSICTERGDYANPIEPSGQGGAKIARGIAMMVGAIASATQPARVWGAC